MKKPNSEDRNALQPGSPLGQSGAPDLNKRRLLQGAAVAAPVILTLRSGAALATSSFRTVQAATPLSKDTDPNSPNFGKWTFDQNPYGVVDSNKDGGVAYPCFQTHSHSGGSTYVVETNNAGQVISTGNMDDDAGTCAGIIMTASSGGSLTGA